MQLLMLTCVFMSDPPDATISSSTDHWYVGLEKAELTCKGGGYPIPHNITWIRYSHDILLSTKTDVQPTSYGFKKYKSIHVKIGLCTLQNSSAYGTGK